MKFHEVFNIPLIMLFFSGIPLSAGRKLINNKCAIRFSGVWGWFLILIFPVYQMSYTLPSVLPNVPSSERILNVLAGITTTSVVFKMYIFNYNIPKYERLINTWDEFMEFNLYPELRKELLLKRKKITNRWIYGFGSAIMFVFFMTSVIPFYTRKVEHETAMPYSRESPDFEIFVFYELILTVTMCLFLQSFNCFLMQIVAFEDVLCNYLNESLEKIMTSLNVTGDGKIIFDKRNLLTGEKALMDIISMKQLMSYREICELAEDQMRVWITLHQILLRYHDVLRDLYGIPLSVEYSALVFLICLMVLMAVSSSLTPGVISNFIGYCGNVYSIFYVTCSYGDLTELSSENLFRASFGENWFIYSRKIRIAYQIIIMRCRKPINLMAFSLYPLNSRSFSTIFKHSYSFLMFLLQVTNRTKNDSLTVY